MCWAPRTPIGGDEHLILVYVANIKDHASTHYNNQNYFGILVTVLEHVLRRPQGQSRPSQLPSTGCLMEDFRRHTQKTPNFNQLKNLSMRQSPIK